MISLISGAFAAQNVNIENLVNASKGDYACTIAETNVDFSADIIEKIAAVEGVIRVIRIV